MTELQADSTNVHEEVVPAEPLKAETPAKVKHPYEVLQQLLLTPLRPSKTLPYSRCSMLRTLI